MSLKLKYGISNIIVFFISKKNSIIIINLFNDYSIFRMLTYGEHYFVCKDFNEYTFYLFLLYYILKRIPTKLYFNPKVIKAHWYTDLPNIGIIRYKDKGVLLKS